MKKAWPAWVFLFLGALFLTTAGISKFWATDAAERTPLDSNQRTHLTGNADLLDPSTGKTNSTPVRITNITQVDPNKSNDTVVTFVTSTCVNQDVDNPADCLPKLPDGKTDPRVISVSQLNFAADRHTAEAIDDPKYVVNDPPVEGLTNKWPFYPEKRSYDVWDDTAKKATPATYIGETTVDGLDCYQYQQVITNAKIDLGNGIDGLYNLDETYVIDKVTGKIINQEVHDVRTLADGGQTALDLTAQYTPDTISSNVDFAKSSGRQLNLVTKTLPIAGLVAGLLCLAVGVLLLVRTRRSDTATRQTPVETPTPSTT